jgi:hypothetical protein
VVDDDGHVPGGVGGSSPGPRRRQLLRSGASEGM